MSYFEKIDNSKYMLAAAAIIASLSKETLLSELGNCFPDLFKNDILQIIITTSSMFIFVRDARISINAALLLYIIIQLVYYFTNREDCLDKIAKSK